MKFYLYLPAFILAIVLFSGAKLCVAQNGDEHQAPDVDGNVWMRTSDQERKAFLFGVGSAVAFEYHIRDKNHEKPSKFVKGWFDALNDMRWSDLSNKITNYYAANPQQLNRLVFEVIWHEIIKPNLNN